MNRTAVVFAVGVVVLAGAQNAAPPKTEPAKDARLAPDAGKGLVTPTDQLIFNQSKVSTEMDELEKRMFRLGESLAKLEPENASRLRMALKYAREELILLRMRQTNEMLQKQSLTEAATEEKQVIAKLQRLQELLLAKDLDFQMKLERLRKLKEIIKKLDEAIKEEAREIKASETAQKDQDQLAVLRKRQQTLAQIVERQREHVADAGTLAGSPSTDGKSDGAAAGKSRTGDGKVGPPSVAQLARAQSSTQASTKALRGKEADAPLLTQAENQMGQAVGKLDAKQGPAKSLPHHREALGALEKELARTNQQANALAAKLERDKFEQMRADQARNRIVTEDLSQGARQLGQNGAAAAEELIRAGGSMAKAESALGGQKPQTAAEQQEQALQSLQYARDQLAGELEKLKDELLPEVHQRVIAALAEMLERQMAIRAATEAQSARLAKKQAVVVGVMAALAKDETKIIELCDKTVSMVEDVEFGIALPGALKVIRRDLATVQTWLAKADASPTTVTLEKRIEADLREMLAAMRQMPSNRPKPKPPGEPQDPMEQEKELNRLIAELKMIRLMQLRINGDTVTTDKSRPPPPLPDPAKQAIKKVADGQTEVRDTTAKLSEQREQRPDPGIQ